MAAPLEIRTAKVSIDVVHIPTVGHAARIKVETPAGHLFYLPETGPGRNPDDPKNRLFDAAVELASTTWSQIG